MEKKANKRAKNLITINGRVFEVPMDIWDTIDWRKVLKEMTDRVYWNYRAPMEIDLHDYVGAEVKERERVTATLCLLLKEGHGMDVDMQRRVVRVPQKHDYDRDGNEVMLPTEPFNEVINNFRLFVIRNGRFPLMDGDHEEMVLRKWYREVGHGLVPVSNDERILFDHLSVEFAGVPKTKAQLLTADGTA